MELDELLKEIRAIEPASGGREYSTLQWCVIDVLRREGATGLRASAEIISDYIKHGKESDYHAYIDGSAAATSIGEFASKSEYRDTVNWGLVSDELVQCLQRHIDASHGKYEPTRTLIEHLMSSCAAVNRMLGRDTMPKELLSFITKQRHVSIMRSEVVSRGMVGGEGIRYSAANSVDLCELARREFPNAPGLPKPERHFEIPAGVQVCIGVVVILAICFWWAWLTDPR